MRQILLSIDSLVQNLQITFSGTARLAIIAFAEQLVVYIDVF